MSLTRFQDTEQLTKGVESFAKSLDALRLAYDQYFVGVIREEPLKLREEVVALVRKYASFSPQNARVRFKLQQVIAKYNAYVVLWDRTLREIDEGRFKRDLFRMRLHQKEKKSEIKPVQDPMEKLFQQFLLVKKQCNEPVEGLSFEIFKRSLMGQVQKLQPQLQGKKLSFQVASEGGKAKIKTLISKT